MPSEKRPSKQPLPPSYLDSFPARGPEELEDLVRSLTGDGQELALHALSAMRGWAQWIDPETGFVHRERVSVSQQTAARQFLADVMGLNTSATEDEKPAHAPPSARSLLSRLKTGSQ